MSKDLFVALWVTGIIGMCAGTPLFYAKNNRLASLGAFLGFGGVALLIGTMTFALLA